MQKLLGNKKAIFLFMFPGLFFFAVFFFIPIFASGGLSLTAWNGIGALQFIGFQNYVKMFTDDPVFWVGIKNTVIILLFQLGLQIPLTILIVLLLDSITKGVRFFKTAFFVPVVFSATAVGLLWLKVYDVNYGLINRLFSMFGVQYSQEWLSSSNSVIFALLAPMIWKSMGYYLIILYAAVKSIPKDYYEAALIDGCGQFQSSLKITVPLMRNAINVVVVLTAISAMREYPIIYVMTAGGPFNSSSTPAIQMFTESFMRMNFGYGSALAMILVLACLLVSFVINKVFPVKDLQY